MPIEKSSSVGINTLTAPPPSSILSGERKRQYESDIAANANANWFYNEYLPKVAKGQDAPETIEINARAGEQSGTPVHRFSSSWNRNKQYSEGSMSDDYMVRSGTNFENLAVSETKRQLSLGPDDTILLNGQTVQSSNLTESQRQLAQQIAAEYKQSESAYNAALEREQQQLKQGMLESLSATWTSPTAYNEAFRGEYGRNATTANTEWVRTPRTQDEIEQRALKESMFMSSDTVWGSAEDIQAGYARVAKYNPDIEIPKEFKVPQKQPLESNTGLKEQPLESNTGLFNPLFDPYGRTLFPSFEEQPIESKSVEKDQYLPWESGFWEDAYRDTNRILRAFGGEWLGAELEARYARDISMRRGQFEGIPATESKYIPEPVFRVFEDIGLETARIIREEPIVPVSSYFGMKAFGAGLGAVAKYSPAAATSAGLLFGADYAYQSGKRIIGSENPMVTTGTIAVTELIPMIAAGRGMKFEVPVQKSTFFSDSYRKMFGYPDRYSLSNLPRDIANIPRDISKSDFIKDESDKLFTTKTTPKNDIIVEKELLENYIKLKRTKTLTDETLSQITKPVFESMNINPELFQIAIAPKGFLEKGIQGLSAKETGGIIVRKTKNILSMLDTTFHEAGHIVSPLGREIGTRTGLPILKSLEQIRLETQAFALQRQFERAFQEVYSIKLEEPGSQLKTTLKDIYHHPEHHVARVLSHIKDPQIESKYLLNTESSFENSFLGDSYRKIFGESKKYPISHFISDTQGSFEMDMLLGRRASLLKKMSKQDPWAKGDFAKNEERIEALKIKESKYGESSVTEVKAELRKMPNEWKAPKTESIQGQITDAKHGSLISIMEKSQPKDLIPEVQLAPSLKSGYKYKPAGFGNKAQRYNLLKLQKVNTAKLISETKEVEIQKPLFDITQGTKTILISGEDIKLISETKQRTNLISETKQKQLIKAVPVNIFKTDLSSIQSIGLTVSTKSLENELTQQTTKQNTEQRTRQTVKQDLKYRFETPQLTQQLFKINTSQITREKFPEPERPRERIAEPRKVKLKPFESEETDKKKKKKRHRAPSFFRTPRINPFHEADFGFENEAFVKAWSK